MDRFLPLVSLPCLGKPKRLSLFIAVALLLLGLSPALGQTVVWDSFSEPAWAQNPIPTYLAGDYGETNASFGVSINNTFHAPGSTQSLALSVTYAAAGASAQVYLMNGATYGGEVNVSGADQCLAMSVYPSAPVTLGFYIGSGIASTTFTQYAGCPIVPTPGQWNTITVPLASAYWDSNFSSINWDQIVEVVLNLIGPSSGSFPDNIQVNLDDIYFSASPCTAGPCSAGPTPSATSTFSPTPSTSPVPSSTPTPTYSPVNSYTPTSSPTVTNSPTTTWTPSITYTPTITSTFTISFTPTNSFTPTATFSPTSSPTPTLSPTVTNSPTITLTPTVTQSPTPNVPKPYLVQIGVYNSAGELVASLWGASTAQPIENLGLEPGNEITSLTGPGSGVSVYGNGQFITSWNGVDSSGNPVSNGQYFIVVSNVDSLGAVTTLTQPVIVDRAPASLTIGIYNSAGEEVRHLYQSEQNGGVPSMNGLQLSSNVLSQAVLGGTTAGQGGLLIQVLGSTVTVTWNGRSDNGLFVAPGIYEVEAHWEGAGGQVEDVERTVVVEPEGPEGRVVARPNVLNMLNGTNSTVFDATGVAGASQLEVAIYTIAGEFVKKVSGMQGTAQVPWNSQGYASGLYIASAVVYDAKGQMLVRQNLQIVLIH